jgi:CMP-N,N'-diacetyllegionaminic acid synthase
MFGNKKVLAVIPARGGSKSIPFKNLSVINGKSLIQRVSEIVNNCTYIDKAILTTDDLEIANEGRKFDLDVPFLRPTELSGDFSNSLDVWKHALLSAEELNKCKYDYTLLLEPTSPLRIQSDIDRVIFELVDNQRESVVTISLTPSHYSPHKALVLKDEMVEFYHDNGKMHSIRQTIPSLYHRNGVCYGVSREYLLNTDSIISNKTFGLIIDRPIVNIDDFFDLELAKYLLK